MIDHFRLLAPLYDRIIPPPDAERLQEVLDLPVQGKLLDVGGGTGRVSDQLRRLVRGIVISDESQAMLRQAQDKGLRCAVSSGAEWLPFAGETFDRVLVVDALHHFADQRRAIGELVRVLKPGGRLVIEEPDLSRLMVKFVAVAEKVALMRSHFLYPHEIGALITACGLQYDIMTDAQFTAGIIANK
jgi:demethylmenaquinone methyltransferase/2-methoxy-6-polyprenyl-1,4-benzoquinol methylase